MTTPPLDLPALRDIANAATEGEWTVGLNGMGKAVYAKWENKHGEYAKQVADVGGDLPDAAHIAALDPPTVLRLLDRVEAAEAKVAVVRELHTKEKHGVRWHCGECLQDDGTGSWEYVEWPCATIRALNGVPDA